MAKRKKEDELRKIAEEIEECALCRSWGTGKPVPGEGDPDAKIAFIGEAPGKEEARTGRPFVGRSGNLLRAMIRGIGLSESEVFITSPVKYLPLRGTPSKENIGHSRAHFLEQFAVIDPDIIVLLGGIACLAVLERQAPIRKEHGTGIEKNGKVYFITFHPAAALRSPETREEFAEDFQKLKRLIDSRKKAPS